MYRRLAAGLLVALLSLLITESWLASPASAHSIDESYVYFDVLPDDLGGRLELRVDDLNEVLDLTLPDTEDNGAGLAAVQPDLTRIQDYAREHFAIRGVDGETWSWTFNEDVEYLATEAGPFIILPFDVDRDFAETPREWLVEFDVFFDEISGNRGFVLISSYWDGGVFNNEADYLGIFDASDRTQTVSLDAPSWWKGFRNTIKLGIDHIKIGTDHILFILVLLVPSVLVFGNRKGDADEAQWHPAPSLRSSFWQVLKIATMFTIAHSITLTLGGLGVLDLPGRPVEALIALSIIAAAFHNLRPIFSNKEWLIAFGFGLFHGLGFAGLLSDLGLDRTRRVWSLLGFNVGVEIGQIIIILLVFPILFILRRTTWYPQVLKIGSLVMAAVAFIWMLERVFDVDLRIDWVMDRVFAFPRILIAVVLLAGVAAAVFLRQRDRGELTPIAEPAQR